MIWNAAWGLVVALALLGSGGCAALPLATIGTAIGTVSSAAAGGSEVYSLGKLDDAFDVDYGLCRRATILAAADLALHMTTNREDDPKKRIWHFRFIDDLGSKIDVTIEGRARHLCRVRVDVGWFGSEPTAKLFMDRIRLHLPSGSGTGMTTRAM
jgi:hypothetical protein